MKIRGKEGRMEDFLKKDRRKILLKIRGRIWRGMSDTMCQTFIRSLS